jgi:hypothetical protein
MTKIDRRQIGDLDPGACRNDPWRCESRCDIELALHRVGIRRAHDAHMQRVRKADVAGELTAPGDHRRVLQL